MRATTNFHPIQKLLVHSPIKNKDVVGMNEKDASLHNFIKIPNPAVLHEQYRNFIWTLKDQGVEVCELDIKQGQKSIHLPNLMFTRDTSITLPWMNGKYIPTKMKLMSRCPETAVVNAFYNSIGVDSLNVFNSNDFIEGGDVLDAIINGNRFVFIGIGKRTTKQSARFFSEYLIENNLADSVILLEHQEDILHLDTGFCVLPGGVCVLAKNAFKRAWQIDKNKKEHSIHFNNYLKQLGLHTVLISKNDAVTNESCNILVLNNRTCISFDLDSSLKDELEKLTGAVFFEIDGSELALASGGVHCLTRPIY